MTQHARRYRGYTHEKDTHEHIASQFCESRSSWRGGSKRHAVSFPVSALECYRKGSTLTTPFRNLEPEPPRALVRKRSNVIPNGHNLGALFSDALCATSCR